MKLQFIQELIRVMSPNEKRAFKRYCAGEAEKKSIQLFDLLNSALTVSSGQAKRKIELTDSSLAKLSDSLFQEIMYFREQASTPDAKAWLRWANSLLQAGQIEAAGFAATRARKMADQQDDLPLRMAVLELQRAIMETEEERQEVGMAYLQLAEQQKRFLDLKLLRNQLGDLIKARAHGNTIILESLRRHPALTEMLPPDRPSRLEYLKCWRILHTFSGDYVAAMQVAEQLVHEFALADTQQYQFEYADELNSLVQLYILTGQVQQARARLLEMAQLQRGQSALDARIYLMSVVTRLAWRLDDLDLEEGKSIVDEVEPWLLEQQGQLDQRLVQRFMFNAMKLEFYAGAYNKCLKWQMRLVSLPGMSTARTPVKVWARCYQLLCIIAQADFEWGMDAIIRQINRAAKEETPNFELPKLIAKIGRHVDGVGLPTPTQLQKWLGQADALALDPVQGRPMRQFLPLDAFLESLLLKVPMTQTERIKREALPVPPRQQAEQA